MNWSALRPLSRKPSGGSAFSRARGWPTKCSPLLALPSETGVPRTWGYDLENPRLGLLCRAKKRIVAVMVLHFHSVVPSTTSQRGLSTATVRAPAACRRSHLLLHVPHLCLWPPQGGLRGIPPPPSSPTVPVFTKGGAPPAISLTIQATCPPNRRSKFFCYINYYYRGFLPA